MYLPMQNKLCLLILAVLLSVGFSTSTVLAEGKKDQTSVAKLQKPLKDKVLKALMQSLKESPKQLKEFTGGERLSMKFLNKQAENLALGITTSNCPSSCNDSVSGGFCRCDKEGGECPTGTTETGGGGKECRASPTSAKVFGGSLNEPARILMP